MVFWGATSLEGFLRLAAARIQGPPREWVTRVRWVHPITQSHTVTSEVTFGGLPGWALKGECVQRAGRDWIAKGERESMGSKNEKNSVCIYIYI